MKIYNDIPHMDEAAILDGIKIEILRSKRDVLVKALNPRRHYDFLRSRCVLSGQDCEEISCRVTRNDQASLFLDKLLDHGPSGLDRLCESLHNERTQMWLLRMLNMEYENKRNNCMALFRPNVNRAPGIELAVDDDTLPSPPTMSTRFQYRQRSADSGIPERCRSTESDLTIRKMGIENTDPVNGAMNRHDNATDDCAVRASDNGTVTSGVSASGHYRQRPKMSRSQEVDLDLPEVPDDNHCKESSEA